MVGELGKAPHLVEESRMVVHPEASMRPGLNSTRTSWPVRRMVIRRMVGGTCSATAWPAGMRQACGLPLVESPEPWSVSWVAK